MSAKVRIKAGPVEFEYEGEAELSIANIKELFTHIESLFSIPSLATPADESSEGELDTTTKPAVKGQKQSKNLHINSIAEKLSAKSGSQLALAAAADLQIIQGKESFTRSELLKAMQAAKLHYKKSMSNNLTKHLSTLIGNEFNQVGQDEYSLKSEAYKQLESQLAS